ncbi:MAG: DNA primase [Candidatus Omnitrophica bacterium]|nr:DNA primase [Candidatus Omnitrophota bacterium]
MGAIPQEIIDRILERVDIVEVISEYVQLKRAGRSHKACCPFHNEKTASFVVSPDKQIYHCFGCGVGGNVLNFVMKYENLEFPDAVRKLALRAGVEIPVERGRQGEGPSLYSRIHEINKLAAAFFQNNLRSEKGRGALEYLRSRGIENQTLSDFRIGYALDDWEALRKYLESRKVPADMVRKAGLSVESDKGRNDYDRFRNRVIFPIFDDRDNIVAFGGRVMDKALPKYIDSPETPVYSKSNVLYGLNFSKRGIREKGYAILVEGYMDVVIPFQQGVKNVVATSGTALTPRQADILKRQASTAVLIFDADQAGEAASLRGLDILVEKGMGVRIAALPKGEDPDTFVRKFGREAFEEVAEKAKDLLDYKLELLLKKFGPRSVGTICDEMLPTISRVENAVVRSDYLTRLAEKLGIHEASLRYEIGKVKPDYSYHYASEVRTEGSARNYRSSEVHLLGMAITGRKYFEKLDRELGLGMFKDPAVKRVMRSVGEMYAAGNGDINASKLSSRLEGDEQAKQVFMEGLAKADITEEKDRVLEDCILRVRKENRDEEIKILTIRLKEAQDSRDDAGVRDLADRINKLYKERAHRHA